jgi:hypothetical protein
VGNEVQGPDRPCGHSVVFGFGTWEPWDSHMGLKAPLWPGVALTGCHSFSACDPSSESAFLCPADSWE